MKKRVRVRFAPSPTGPLHIGGVRTALFNYLFAKQHGGDFLLRIEDTDQTRYVQGAEKYIIESLNWCGIPFDEGVGKEKDCGPYRQSERKNLYKQYVDELLNKGWAYIAFDTNEALEAHRKDHEAKGKTFIYNHHNREKLDNALTISPEITQKRIANKEEYVVRFKTPTNRTLHFSDLIRGDIQVDTNQLDDKVLFKSDGMPTYHLANIVDDHLMNISHVIRGEEWLPSLPLHILLYEAFGWETPEFAHLPLILKPVGNGKLSKRDGDKLGFPVFPLEWNDPKTNEISSGYREQGYLPEAVINMLALLGWNPGTEQEIFSLDELIKIFDLSKVNKSGAKFDPEKTKWFQHQYFVKQDDAIVTKEFQKILEVKNIRAKDVDVEKIVRLIKERATFTADLWDLCFFFFEAPENYDEKASKNWKPDTTELLHKLIQLLENTATFQSEAIENAVKDWLTKDEIGMGKIMQPFRLSLVGALKGPHLFDIAALIGRKETIRRIENAIKHFSV